MTDIIKITTEADCEGRTMKELGTFKGTKEQAVQYCIDNDLRPYYQYTIRAVSDNIIDVTQINTPLELKNVNAWDGYRVVEGAEIETALRKKAALAKLTHADIKILGLS